MSSLLAAVDQIQGPSGTTWWVYVLAGAGIGGVVAAIVSSVVTLLGQRWQRGHEIRMEEIRDRQRLRDARLDRLRDDVRETTFVVFDLQEVAYLVDAQSMVFPFPAPQAWQGANEKFASSVERFNLARGRLVLDPDGHRLAQAIVDLANGVSELQAMVSDRARMKKRPDEHENAEWRQAFRERQESVTVKVHEVIKGARQLLQEIEERPLV